MMDTHVRPYFSPSPTQIDVDAALFARALEQNDAQLAKKLFVDMNILPPAICGPWCVSRSRAPGLRLKRRAGSLPSLSGRSLLNI